MSVGVVLDPVAPVVAPLVRLAGVVKVCVAGELFAEAEGRRPLRLVLRPLEFGLDDKVFGAPRVGEVDVF